MSVKLKDDLVLKAILGTEIYDPIKKYIPSWQADYLVKQSKGFVMSWIDYLKLKIAEHNQKDMSFWVVYADGKKIGQTRAASSTEAVNRFKPFTNATEIKAVAKAIMSVRA